MRVSTLMDWLARILVGLIVTLVIVMLGVLALQVGLRYLFSITLPWSEELALAMFSWSVLLTAPLGVREGFHARLLVLVDNLPAVARKTLELLIDLGTALFGLALAWSGMRYVLESEGMRSAAIGYPIGLLYASLPVSGVLIVMFALESAFKGRAARIRQVENV
jgi:TRAP-type C4-dicarboxylate transport system permease small subunit